MVVFGMSSFFRSFKLYVFCMMFWGFLFVLGCFWFVSILSSVRRCDCSG